MDLPVSALGRLVGVGTCTAGGWMLMRPRQVSELVGDGTPPTVVMRLLGVRYLVQGLAQLACPDREVLRAAGVVDTLHAASMVPLIVASSRYRRVALVSASAATGSALLNRIAAARAAR